MSKKWKCIKNKNKEEWKEKKCKKNLTIHVSMCMFTYFIKFIFGSKTCYLEILVEMWSVLVSRCADPTIDIGRGVRPSATAPVSRWREGLAVAPRPRAARPLSLRTARTSCSSPAAPPPLRRLPRPLWRTAGRVHSSVCTGPLSSTDAPANSRNSLFSS